MLIQPSEFEFARVMNATDHAESDDYDMEIVNYLYKDSALIIPRRPYAVLTGEWRSNEHAEYLGNTLERWDPEKIFKEAKYLHFSDWPIPKVVFCVRTLLGLLLTVCIALDPGKSVCH